jgi:hypothetical protein
MDRFALQELYKVWVLREKNIKSVVSDIQELVSCDLTSVAFDEMPDLLKSEMIAIVAYYADAAPDAEEQLSLTLEVAGVSYLKPFADLAATDFMDKIKFILTTLQKYQSVSQEDISRIRESFFEDMSEGVLDQFAEFKNRLPLCIAVLKVVQDFFKHMFLLEKIYRDYLDDQVTKKVVWTPST